MHDHRNGGERCRRPDPRSREYETEKLVLLELVVDPPETGDRTEVLCEVLDIARAELEAAVEALTAVGLARRLSGVVFASEAATYFEYLWPTRL